MTHDYFLELFERNESFGMPPARYWLNFCDHHALRTWDEASAKVEELFPGSCIVNKTLISFTDKKQLTVFLLKYS